jgi:hypothetical protein
MSVSPITQRVRNNIIRVLSDAHPQALSTPEVLAQLTEHYGCNHAYRRNHDDPRYVPTYSPHGCTATPQYSCRGQCWHNQAYPSLRALHRQDSVEWLRAGYPNREACQRYTPNPDPDLSPAPEPEPPQPDDPPHLHEIIDLDAPSPDKTAGRNQRSARRHAGTTTQPQPARGDRRKRQVHETNYAAAASVPRMRPSGNTTRSPTRRSPPRKPWPQPYWLCSTHANESETSTTPGVDDDD